MINVTPINDGTSNVIAPYRQGGMVIGTPILVQITNGALISDLPLAAQIFLEGKVVRTIFTPLQLVSKRARLVTEYPGYRFAYRGDIDYVLKEIIGDDTAFSFWQKHEGPLDLIPIPPESFVVI
jgi:hypothetical protein